jgi:DNA-binding response OmpR family regulator
MARNILLIDDDEEMCEEVSEILRDEGYDVSIAGNGVAGERMALEKEYAVVLLDLKMPGKSGREVLKGIRGAGVHSAVFILTGSPLGGTPIIGDEMQIRKDDELLDLADGILNKPFDVDAVLEAVRQAVESTSARSGTK